MRSGWPAEPARLRRPPAGQRFVVLHPGLRARLSRRAAAMNKLQIKVTGVKALVDDKGRGLKEGKNDLWVRVTLDSTGQSNQTDKVEKADSEADFDKKMSL